MMDNDQDSVITLEQWQLFEINNFRTFLISTNKQTNWETHNKSGNGNRDDDGGGAKYDIMMMMLLSKCRKNKGAICTPS